MKKFLALIMALAMVMSLAACGSSSSESTAAETTAAETAAAETEAAETAAAETAAAETEAADAEFTTLEEGKLIMATNAQFPPYEMVADGEGVNGTGFEGIDVEIASAVAEKLGLELEIDDMEFDSALVAVQEGRCDIVFAGLTYTEERDEIMDFSTSYSQGVQVVIVPEGSEIASVDDLANVDLIGCQRGTTGYIYCCDDYGDDHVAAYDNGAQAVQALMNGQVDCVVIDQQPALSYVADNEGLSILETAYVTEDYCAAMAEGNTALQTAVNDALAQLTEDGTIQSILDKYISAD